MNCQNWGFKATFPLLCETYVNCLLILTACSVLSGMKVVLFSAPDKKGSQG